jgi:hypothetical protein
METGKKKEILALTDTSRINIFAIVRFLPAWLGGTIATMSIGPGVSRGWESLTAMGEASTRALGCVGLSRREARAVGARME